VVQLTPSDIDFLIEAVTAWEKSDVAEFMVTEALRSALLRGKAEYEVLAEQMSTMKRLNELEQNGKERSERAILIKAQLIQMKRDMVLNGYKDILNSTSAGNTTEKKDANGC
jgi:hypothetical protein